jgi:hypothetical protein
MDDFLTSDLTDFHYESVAKDSIEVVAWLVNSHLIMHSHILNICELIQN